MLRKLTLISRICGEQKNGGERGIRTLDTREGITIFETVAFDHSAISPLVMSSNIALVFAKVKFFLRDFILFF